MIFGYAPLGFQGELVRIEVDLRRGIPGMDLIGLANQAVQEARERVRVALRRSGFTLWEGRVLISLAPADLRKNGGGYDLALAAAILEATAQVPTLTEPILALGELSLEGGLRPVPGVMGAALLARQLGVHRILVPKQQHNEAASVPGLSVFPVQCLAEVPEIFQHIAAGGEAPGVPQRPDGSRLVSPEFRVRGPQVRPITAAAAGGHHLLLVGPPGTGKTLAARSLAALLPPPTAEEEIDINRVASLVGDWKPEVGWIKQRPVRFVSPGASREGLCGGSDLKPGEVTRSHAGLLILDEALEFSSNVLQSLRHPTQDGEVFVVRSGQSYRFPARFQLVMTANPCPCGRLGLPQSVCYCTQAEIHQYWKVLGGPMLDRVDLRVWCSPLKTEDLLQSSSVDLQSLRSRVENAVHLQRLRNPGAKLNAQLDLEEIIEVVQLDTRLSHKFSEVGGKWGWSGRARLGILKVARTLADLEERSMVTASDLEEAIRFRLYGELGFGREHLDISSFLS